MSTVTTTFKEMSTWEKVKHSILKNSHISISFMEKQLIQLKQIIPVHTVRVLSVMN